MHEHMCVNLRYSVFVDGKASWDKDREELRHKSQAQAAPRRSSTFSKPKPARPTSLMTLTHSRAALSQKFH